MVTLSQPCREQNHFVLFNRFGYCPFVFNAHSCMLHLWTSFEIEVNRRHWMWNRFKPVNLFMCYCLETIFLHQVIVTLTSSPRASLSTLTCFLWCNTCAAKFVQINDAVHKLSSRNSFFSRLSWWPWPHQPHSPTWPVSFNVTLKTCLN